MVVTEKLEVGSSQQCLAEGQESWLVRCGHKRKNSPEDTPAVEQASQRCCVVHPWRFLRLSWMKP